MPDPKKKLVQVNGVGVVEFPHDMPDHHIAASIKAHLSNNNDDNYMPGLGDVPAFLKNSLDMNKVRQVATEPETEQERHSTAYVSSKDPYTIKVLAPDLYGPPIRDHELTHTFQDTRNKSLPQVSTQVISSGRSAYDYGGIKGLQAARLQRKTISDFNYEQQAEMVKDYKAYHDQYLKKAASGKITPADMKAMYDLQQAYHPFIKQLASMPGTQEKLQRNPLLELLGVQKPATINTKPEPPGLPAYNTPGLGVLPADSLMGGKSQSTIAAVKEKAAKLNPKANTPLPPQPKNALNQHPNPEDRPAKESFAFNKAWSKPGPYATTLSPQLEAKFQQWMKANPGVVNPAELSNPQAGYDVRGWWLAGERGDPAGSRVRNKWDGKMHSSDKFKTPYNGSFSNESMYALPNAPKWVGDKLMTSDGKLVTDETPRKAGVK